MAGRALKESEHILTRFEELTADFSPVKPLRYTPISYSKVCIILIPIERNC